METYYKVVREIDGKYYSCICSGDNSDVLGKKTKEYKVNKYVKSRSKKYGLTIFNNIENQLWKFYIESF